MGAALDAPAVLVEAAGCFDYSFACWLNLCLAVFFAIDKELPQLRTMTVSPHHTTPGHVMPEAACAANFALFVPASTCCKTPLFVACNMLQFHCWRACGAGQCTSVCHSLL